MPTHVAKRCSDLGIEGAVMTDLNSISGSIDFISAMKNKKKKPVIGCEFTVVSDYETKTKNASTVSLIAKNYEGWLSLAKAISKANTHYYYEKPHITLEDLGDVITEGSVFCLVGWNGSDLADSIFNYSKEVYTAQSVEEVKTYVTPDWYPNTERKLAKYKDIFGASNVYLTLQLVDADTMPVVNLLANGIRYLARKTNTPIVGVPDSYYTDKVDAYDQRVLLVNRLNTNLKAVHRKTVGGDDIALGRFFKGVNYHLPSYEEMIGFGHTPEELENTLAVAAACDVYSLENKPMLPKFPTPNGELSADYLRFICREGWEKRKDLIEAVIRQGKHTRQVYDERFETEFKVLTEVGLADYFLIVHDVIDYAIRDGQLTGAGRGSAAGSLILYLLSVTHVDPIEYDLLFERFYNAGRNTAEHISLPDVDMDFEKHGRERVLQYVRSKYGQDHVAQMITFQRMQGRGAIKDVVRAHDVLSVEEVNKITKLIPQDFEIADQLEILKEADKAAGGEGEASIIEWALDAHPKDFKEWVFYDDKGNLQGPLAKIFEQAIRMEGTKRGKGKHAAGVVISQQRLADICPMSYDETTKEMIADMEMTALEKRGQVKFDFLGISTLDKVHAAINHLRTGKLYL